MFAYMTPKLWLFGIILPFVLALAITAFIHPFIVRMAKSRNMVDEPDGRKLQRTPIPVMGGMAVFFGIVMERVPLPPLIRMPCSPALLL